MLSEKILESIISEYPELAELSPKIEKQFIASDGRKYNTYLLSTSHSDYPKLVAKGLVNESIDLNKERVIIKLLSGNKINVPILFNQDNISSKYLLLQYIEGERLENALSKREIKSDEVFKKLGELIGKMHTVKVSKFGELLNESNPSWHEYVTEKFTERLSFSKKKGYKKLVEYSENLWRTTKGLVKEQGKEIPIINHRDLYLDNFILTPKGELYILDLGLVRGGRPFFDLGKFYLLILKKFPKQSESFVEGYKNFIKLDKNSPTLLRFYIVLEILGMMPFYHSIGNEKVLDEVLRDFKDLTDNKGLLNTLIDEFK